MDILTFTILLLQLMWQIVLKEKTNKHASYKIVSNSSRLLQIQRSQELHKTERDTYRVGVFKNFSFTQIFKDLT